MINQNCKPTVESAGVCGNMCHYCKIQSEHQLLATKLVDRTRIVEGLTRLFSDGYISIGEVLKWFKQNEDKLWPTDHLNGMDKPTLAQICVLKLLALPFFDVKVDVDEKGNAISKVKVKFSLLVPDIDQIPQGYLYNHQIDANWTLMTWI